MKATADNTHAGDAAEDEHAGAAGRQPAAGLDRLTEGLFRLPALPYEPGDLERVYHRALLERHYQLHGSLVEHLNATLKQLPQAGVSRSRKPTRFLSHLLAYQWSEHALHTLFWRSMTPRRLAMPDDLSVAMINSFGSIRNAKHYFVDMASQFRPRGWAILAYDKARDKLSLFQTGELVNLAAWPVTPLLVCDVWEHAYQAQYGRRKDRWVRGFLEVVNWDAVAVRYAEARRSQAILPDDKILVLDRPVSELNAWATAG